MSAHRATVHPTPQAAPLPPLRTIRQVVKDHNDSGLGWLYRELADHLRRVGPSTLTTQEIADFVGGMSADTTKSKLAILVTEGLLKRVRKGRGAYTYRLPDPVTVNFAPAKPAHERVNPPHVREKTRHETEKTPPLLNDMNESMSDGFYIVSEGDGLEGESDQRRLIRTMDFNTPHKPGKALFTLADQCDPEEVRRLVHLDDTHAAANPYAYLHACLTNWLERQQDTQQPRPPKSKPQSKFAVPDGITDTPVQATEDTTTEPPGGPIIWPEPVDPPDDDGTTDTPPDNGDTRMVRRVLDALHTATGNHPAMTGATLRHDGSVWSLRVTTSANVTALSGRRRQFLQAALEQAVGLDAVLEVVT